MRGGGRKLLSGDDSSKFMIQGEMEKSHRYAYSDHCKGGGDGKLLPGEITTSL